MKIREYILEKELVGYKYRLDKLIEIGAPQVIIDRQRELVGELENGVISVSGDKEVLEFEFNKSEKKTGRGGKVYIQFICDNCLVNYFPTAKYGRYIKRA